MKDQEPKTFLVTVLLVVFGFTAAPFIVMFGLALLGIYTSPEFGWALAIGAAVGLPWAYHRFFVSPKRPVSK